ncbi:MAG: hypothetical protein KCHDKBKB_01781 [Elusimicrobia bacterium]|nr:hypothetical protein [Elusimicrobiota bacterium]
MRRIISIFLLLIATHGTISSADSNLLVVLQVQGVINPVIGDYIKEEIEQAEKNNASAVLIELDTPGGLLDTTRDIIGSMINADFPVIVYVSPRGARATSAGVFITMASDVAAMAPGTHLGAAHPVNIGGDTPSMPTNSKESKTPAKNDGNVMNEKMVSDAAAYIRSIAADKGRNAAWAEKAVRESVSLTSEEALKEKVIEYVAESQEELLKALEGKTITKNGKKIVLNLTGKTVRIVPMSPFKKFLQILAHPNVAYILMTLGVYGLIYELASPGIGLGGVVGGICLLLAFFSLQILPINMVGLALIVLGVLMLILELLNPTHGLLTFGGLIAFALGSFFLIDTHQNPSLGRVSIELIASTVGVTALFFGVALKKTLAAKQAKPRTGAESLIGMIGTVTTALQPEGNVDLNGELWTAISDLTVESGEKVKVVKVDGIKLYVEKV